MALGRWGVPWRLTRLGFTASSGRSKPQKALPARPGSGKPGEARQVLKGLRPRLEADTPVVNVGDCGNLPVRDEQLAPDVPELRARAGLDGAGDIRPGGYPVGDRLRLARGVNE